MKKLLTILTTMALLQSCGLVYNTIEMPDLHLSVEADESAQLIKSDSREALIRDSLGATQQYTRIDRKQYGDEDIGKLIIATAQEEGLKASTLEGLRMEGENVVGGYVMGEKNDSIYLVGGFIGQKSAHGYIAIYHYPKVMKSEAKYSMESVSYTK